MTSYLHNRKSPSSYRARIWNCCHHSIASYNLLWHWKYGDGLPKIFYKCGRGWRREPCTLDMAIHMPASRLLRLLLPAGLNRLHRFGCLPHLFLMYLPSMHWLRCNGFPVFWWHLFRWRKYNRNQTSSLLWHSLLFPGLCLDSCLLVKPYWPVWFQTMGCAGRFRPHWLLTAC